MTSGHASNEESQRKLHNQSSPSPHPVRGAVSAPVWEGGSTRCDHGMDITVFNHDDGVEDENGRVELTL